MISFGSLLVILNKSMEKSLFNISLEIDDTDLEQ
jgi:hypothetical protein